MGAPVLQLLHCVNEHAMAGVDSVQRGDLLAGKYRVERVLGSGGMGVVVAARHVQHGQLVAIKFLRAELLTHPEASARFLLESQAVSRLTSEHVARVLDFGTLDTGAPYMAMEFLDGQDLGQILDETGPMRFEIAANLIQQACSAVAEAHAVGIVHRDLKPQNLFLTTSPTG